MNMMLRKMAVAEAEAIKKELKKPIVVVCGKRLPDNVIEVQTYELKTMWDMMYLIARITAGELLDGGEGTPIMSVANQIMLTFIESEFTK